MGYRETLFDLFRPLVLLVSGSSLSVSVVSFGCGASEASIPPVSVPCRRALPRGAAAAAAVSAAAAAGASISEPGRQNIVEITLK